MQYRYACWLLALLIATTASAQIYYTGTVYSQSEASSYPHSCSDTLYDPEVFVLPNGDLAMIGQGGNGTYPLDSFFSFQRNQTNGQWSGASSGNPGDALPSARGQYSRCGYSPAGIPGPIASPSVVKVGSTYYMAYSGGNADYITGRVYWATSTDGVNWSPFTNGAGAELIAPIIYPKYHNVCSLPTNGGSGVGQLNLVNDGLGHFVFFLRYGHDQNGTLLSAEHIAFRISIDPSAPGGLGATREIWYNGAWNTNSGHFVWDYDDCEGSPCMSEVGDALLSPLHSVQSMGLGAGDVKYDPNFNVLGGYVHFYQSVAGQPLQWESLTSLSVPEWGSPGTVDLTSFL